MTVIKQFKYFFLPVLLAVLGSCASPAQSLETGKIYVLIADEQVAPRLKEITPFKIEAAVNLACKLTGKYVLIPKQVRDSIVDLFAAEKKEPTVAAIAQRLKADRILFVNVNSIGNMLRVAVSGVNTHDSSDRSGVGYEQIRYREEKTNKVVYDPSLLRATQRAFASMEKDSLMYDKADNGLRVFPAKTLVVGSIDFQDDSALKKWDLFQNKSLSSYDAVETVFRGVFDDPKYVVYDTESRDSIYAAFKMMLPDNSNPVSQAEVDALGKFEVDYFITGQFKRVNSGAIVELYLCQIDGKNLHMIKKEMDVLTQDSNPEFRKVLQNLVKKLTGT